MDIKPGKALIPESGETSEVSLAALLPPCAGSRLWCGGGQQVEPGGPPTEREAPGTQREESGGMFQRRELHRDALWEVC